MIHLGFSSGLYPSAEHGFWYRAHGPILGSGSSLLRADLAFESLGMTLTGCASVPDLRFEKRSAMGLCTPIPLA